MANPQQILAGVATTLASAITSGAQTTGIMVNKLPAAYNSTSGVPTTATFSNNVQMVEGLTFTGVTGSNPWTLTGVVRNTEIGGSAGTYANGSNIAIGSITAGLLQTGLSYDAVGLTGIVSNDSGLNFAGGILSFDGSNYSPLTGSDAIIQVGIVTHGTWNADIIAPAYGGTGFNNGTNTLNVSGGTLTFNLSGNSTYTMPASGTILTTSTQVVKSVTNGSGLNLSAGVLSFNGSTYALASQLPFTIASNNSTGISAAVTSFLTVTPSVLGTYRIGCYLTVTAATIDVVQVRVMYTDETAASRTINLSGLVGAVGVTAISPVDIRAASGSPITVLTVLTTGGGTIAYDLGASIQQMN